MPRWIGLLGSWALLVLGLGLAAIAGAGEWINVKDARRLGRLHVVDRLIAERNRARLDDLRKTASTAQTAVSSLQSRVTGLQRAVVESQDTDRTILISTAENHVWLRSGRQVLFEAVCSTGKGTTLVDGGRTMRFDTPIGKFRILSKEVNPVWVPPDWHFAEEARKRGMRVVRLNYGEAIDADTGGPVRKANRGVWSWFGDSTGDTSRTFAVRDRTVVEIEAGRVVRELPPGEIITAGDAVVIPPIGTPQRKYDKVLGSYRLNLGDGYALHGTLATDQLGRSVSHGCVRLADPDIEQLFNLTEVGDEVIIY